MATTHESTLSYMDATGETTTFTVYNGPITALTIAAYLTELGALRAATEALTLGNKSVYTWTGDRDQFFAVPATDPAAQRESKLLVTYKDNTTSKPHSLAIGTIDFSKLTFVPGAKDAVPLDASAEIIAWITAFQAIAKAPDTGNAVTVTKLRFVGRNT